MNATDAEDVSWDMTGEFSPQLMFLFDDSSDDSDAYVFEFVADDSGGKWVEIGKLKREQDLEFD